MVGLSFFVTCAIAFVTFSLGRMSGRLEATLLFRHRLAELLTAIKSVENLAMLRGEDLSKISREEIVSRAEKLLEIKRDE